MTNNKNNSTIKSGRPKGLKTIAELQANNQLPNNLNFIVGKYIDQSVTKKIEDCKLNEEMLSLYKSFLKPTYRADFTRIE